MEADGKLSEDGKSEKVEVFDGNSRGTDCRSDLQHSEYNIDNALHTPSRFLLNCFSELTPSFGERYGFEEANPFEQSFNEDIRTREKHVNTELTGLDLTAAKLASYPSPVSPPTSVSSSDAGSEPFSSPVKPTKSLSASKATVFKSQGPENFEPGTRASKYKTLKHKLSIDEDEDEEDMEIKRLRFLERNRQAGMYSPQVNSIVLYHLHGLLTFYSPLALKCRQKKKQWEKELQVRSDEVVKRNKALRATVQELKEEAILLKNQLLAHSECDCTVIREYIAKSGSFKFYSQDSYGPDHPMVPMNNTVPLQVSPDMSHTDAYSLFTNSD
ncbi:hypothetical protein INT44_005174 [Umbelopsis vinacea]|uniref:BZIP domain-containing protein n=1 Tax=Umbelopsis vinacea TaxID=44442 RepID=A0A8H7Q8X0_9FUNG|nr:hypothetical protein INT44_005174 [Umbelopsis vinacea]